MRLSNRQKAMLHWVPAAMGIGEATRLMIQRNVGGFESAADPRASRGGFIAVMAYYEGRSAGGRIRGFTAGYWLAQDAKAKGTDAVAFACRRAARRLGWDDAKLDGFLAGKHMSSGACRTVATASAYWLGRLLTALKTIIAREARRGSPDAGGEGHPELTPGSRGSRRRRSAAGLPRPPARGATDNDEGPGTIQGGR